MYVVAPSHLFICALAAGSRHPAATQTGAAGKKGAYRMDIDPERPEPKVSVDSVHVDKAIRHLQDGGKIRRSMLTKLLGVSDRQAGNVITCLKQIYGAELEKSGNGYVLWGSSVVQKTGNSGNSGNDTEEEASIDCASLNDPHPKGRKNSLVWKNNNPDSQDSNAGPLTGRLMESGEEEHRNAYQDKITKMIQVCDIEKRKMVSNNKSIGLLRKRRKDIPAGRVHKYTHNIRRIRGELRRLVVKGGGCIQFAELERLERRLTKHVPDWRECVEDPAAMLDLEFGYSAGASRSVYDDSYTPQPPKDQMDCDVDAEMAGYQAEMAALQAPPRVENQEADEPAVENLPTVIEDSPVDEPPVEKDLATPPTVQEEAPGAPETTEITLPLAERITNYLRETGKYEYAKTSAILRAVGEDWDTVIPVLAQMEQAREIRSMPPAVMRPEWRFRLAA